MPTSKELEVLAAIDMVSLRKMPEYQLAMRLAKTVKNWRNWIAERSCWRNWYDQIDRSSGSILLNLAEAHGKGRGYLLSALLISKGEATETGASLDIGPAEICEELMPVLDQYLSLVNTRLKEMGTQ